MVSEVGSPENQQYVAFFPPAGTNRREGEGSAEGGKANTEMSASAKSVLLANKGSPDDLHRA